MKVKENFTPQSTVGLMSQVIIDERLSVKFCRIVTSFLLMMELPENYQNGWVIIDHFHKVADNLFEYFAEFDQNYKNGSISSEKSSYFTLVEYFHSYLQELLSLKEDSLYSYLIWLLKIQDELFYHDKTELVDLMTGLYSIEMTDNYIGTLDDLLSFVSAINL